MSITSYSINELVLVRYPLTDLTTAKVRPAVVVSAPHVSEDLFTVPLTSRTHGLLPGEFILQEWSSAGLHGKDAGRWLRSMGKSTPGAPTLRNQRPTPSLLPENAQ